MFSNFFKRKLQNLKEFFVTRMGKTASAKDLRLRQDQSKITETSAYDGIDPDSKRYQPDPKEKVLRESGGQDISAI